MRKALLFYLLTWLIVACKQENKKYVSQHLFIERSLPEDVLSVYLDKAALSNIKNGVDSFEIRKWYPFYYTDSFPVSLERFYFRNGVLNAECYLFSDKAGGLVMGSHELEGLQFEKYEIKNISVKFIDSIQTHYNFANIEGFDLNLVRERNASTSSIQTPRKYFFEQATQNHYYGVFITNPTLYPELNENLDKYAAYSKFTFETLCAADSGFQKWFEEKGQVIVNNR